MAHRSKETETEREIENQPPARATQTKADAASPLSLLASGGSVGDRSRDGGTATAGRTEPPPDGTAAHATARQLAGWATGAVASRWGTGSASYTPESAADAAKRLGDAAIPSAFVQRSIYSQARDSRSTEPPKSIRWFVPGILREWEEMAKERRA